MVPDFEPRLRAFAEVIVRVGLNLQPGQRLLIAEPYELQGVARSAEVIVEAVRRAAACDAEVIWGDGPRLREFAEKADWGGFSQLASGNAKRLADGIRRGDALLFLQSSQPRLLDGVPAERVAELRRIGWEHFGPVAQQLVQGATNWTAAPAPIPAWAHAVYADLPSDQRLAALWQDVFTATRVNEPSPLAAWKLHLRLLQRECASLNQRRLRTLRYKGEGTDLSVALPPGHVWCTAQLATKSGLSFVANLPTEEIFTAPHRDSAEGHVKRFPARSATAAAIIDGIELEFKRGSVVAASARAGADLLERLLDTDEGSGPPGRGGRRPGADLAWPGEPTSSTTRCWTRTPPATSRSAKPTDSASVHPTPAALNRSLVHVDLPFDASIIRSDTEPA
jgi:aminopeptidase